MSLSCRFLITALLVGGVGCAGTATIDGAGGSSSEGGKSGTGGSEGAAYLRKTVERKFFPELWEVRNHLGATNDTP